MRPDPDVTRREERPSGLAALAPPAQECPMLVPVMADQLWLSPTSVYCRRPNGRVRVPAAATLACICTTPAHLVCPDYLAGGGRPG